MSPTSKDKKPKITKQPTYYFWYPHVLRSLSTFLAGSAKSGEAYQRTLSFFNVDDAVREEVNKNGKSTLYNRIAWARQYLVFADYIDDSKHGVWALTDKAKDRIPDILASIDQDISNGVGEYPIPKGRKVKVQPFIDEVASLQVKGGRKGKDQQKKLPTKKVDKFSGKVKTDSIENEKSEKDAQLQKELEIIKSIDPDKFENLCSKIFEVLNYEDVEVTKKSRDGGFDGIGYLVFGLVRFKVVFQAKRYTKVRKTGRKIKVSVQEMDRFLGAMIGTNGPDRGVFITTSEFSSDATTRAEEVGSKITLINGNKLIELLRKYKIGYAEKLVIDQEFFKNL